MAIGMTGLAVEASAFNQDQYSMRESGTLPEMEVE